MAIDDQDQLYIVDMTARIQVFDGDGKFLRGWQTPEHAHGKPTGLSIAPDGILLVADTHYYRVLDLHARRASCSRTARSAARWARGPASSAW